MAELGQDQLLQELRSLQTELQEMGIVHIDLFGSRARGDHQPDSDIDLLVDLSDDEKLSLLDLISLSHLVEDHVGVPTSLVLRRSAPRTFLDRTAPDLLRVF